MQIKRRKKKTGRENGSASFHFEVSNSENSARRGGKDIGYNSVTFPGKRHLVVKTYRLCEYIRYFYLFVFLFGVEKEKRRRGYSTTDLRGVTIIAVDALSPSLATVFSLAKYIVMHV